MEPGGMNARRVEWTEGWTERCQMNGGMDGQIDRGMEGCRDGWMDEWTEGWMDELRDERTDG